MSGRERPSETEVSYFDITLRIEQNIRRFEVTMKNISRVEILETFQYLVDDVLFVDVFENVSSDDSVHVDFHGIEYQVNIFIVLGSDYIEQSDYVLVAC